MPKICYVEKKFFGSSRTIIASANQIIEEYQAQGFQLTLRQLYYQFVSRDLIANTMKEYKRLGSVINDARLAGQIDWDSIEDRTRNLAGLTHWSSPAEIVRSCLHSYRVDKWADQQHRVEVWVEKDALIGVIEGACSRMDVDYFSCRGYTSQSEMWRAGERLQEYVDAGQTPVIIHLGDHDPSGIDMTRDIDDRLELFMGGLKVKRVALSMQQIQKYNPPPNPAKITDSRFASYKKKFGPESWELDALEPKVIDQLIEKTVLSFRDEDKWMESAAAESWDRKKIEKAIEACK